MELAVSTERLASHNPRYQRCYQKPWPIEAITSPIQNETEPASRTIGWMTFMDKQEHN